MTTPDRRDRALESWLARNAEDAGGSTDVCLDAETAAAWLDGGLARDARLDAEEHVAGCARCQMLLATLSAAFDAETADRAPSLEAAPAWSKWLLWSAPLAAAAAAALAVFVWTGGPGRGEPQPTSLARAQESPTPTVPPGVAAPPRMVEPLDQGSESGAAAQGQGGRRTDSPRRGTPAGDAARSDRSDAAERADAASRADVTGSAKMASAESANGAATPGAQAKAGAERVPDPSSDDAAPSVLNETIAVAPAPAASPAAPTPQGRAPAEFAAPQALARAPAPDEIHSPDPDSRWRLRGLRVERSADGGRTWTDSRVPGDVPLTAGSSPAPSVCWIVGRRGTVLVTTDGVNWVRRGVSPPADLVAVLATGAGSAVVTTVDGRRLSTSDGGITWVPVER